MIAETTQHLGVLSIAVHIPAAQSLKEKRMVLRSLKDRLRKRFNVSISEIDGHNKWQVATIAIAMVGNDQRYIDRCLQNILSFVEGTASLELCEHEVVFY